MAAESRSSLNFFLKFFFPFFFFLPVFREKKIEEEEVLEFFRRGQP